MTFHWTSPPPLFPEGGILHSVRFDEDTSYAELFDEGYFYIPKSIEDAVDKRKRHFLLGRYCAQLALEALTGESWNRLGIDDDGAPLWPEGIVGSITHTRNYAGAVVEWREKCSSLGLDSEWVVSRERAEKIGRMVFCGDERERRDEWELSLERCLALVFSAKETIYKCIHPLIGVYFGFHKVEITEVTDGVFRFRLLDDLHRDFPADWVGEGRYHWDGDLVHTGMWLED